MSGNFVIVGLPASGKTTFLAALWHLISSDEKESRLRLESYEGDFKYLNKIAEAWRRFQPVVRTSQVGDTDVGIRLEDRLSGTTGTAFFPDLAGETFDVQVEERKCRPRFIDGVNGDSGLLFFVSANTKEDNLSVNELNARLEGIGLDIRSLTDSAKAAGIGGVGTETLEWEPKHVPTQVRIVQLLSDFLVTPFEVRPRKLALIISAWDLVRELGLSPDAWLSQNFPLLHQFLLTNSSTFELRVYGVSAQGVDLRDKAAVTEAADCAEHSSRIQIVGPEGDGHDLTLPLIWLMAKE